MKDFYGRKLTPKDYMVYGLFGKPQTKTQKVIFWGTVAVSVVLNAAAINKSFKNLK